MLPLNALLLFREPDVLTLRTLCEFEAIRQHPNVVFYLSVLQAWFLLFSSSAAACLRLSDLCHAAVW